MSSVLIKNPSYQTTYELRLEGLMPRLNDREFYEFCQQNPDLRIEQNATGELIVMPPTGGKTGNRNFTITTDFGKWVERDGTGYGFDSSTVFVLPNGAKRAPDVAWVSRHRWAALTDDEQEKFPPVCPEFVIELRSVTDTVEELQAKMREYIAAGARLGWLLDPYERKAYIFRPEREMETLDNPPIIEADEPVRGFTLHTEKIWS